MVALHSHQEECCLFPAVEKHFPLSTAGFSRDHKASPVAEGER